MVGSQFWETILRKDNKATPVRKELAGDWQRETAEVFLMADNIFRGPAKDGTQRPRARHNLRNRLYS